MFASGAIAGESRPAGNTVFDTAIEHGQMKHTPRADAYAPIGVMGGHHPHRGLMLSYRYSHMGMEGNLIGDDSVSPDSIVTTVPNRFFGIPGQPPTLRVVPTGGCCLTSRRRWTTSPLPDRLGRPGSAPSPRTAMALGTCRQAPSLA
jgi:hypothetical protein